jgi:hypothetical protein
MRLLQHTTCNIIALGCKSCEHIGEDLIGFKGKQGGPQNIEVHSNNGTHIHISAQYLKLPVLYWS